MATNKSGSISNDDPLWSKDVSRMDYSQLQLKKETIRSRLSDLASSGCEESRTPSAEETQWDYVLKEMVSTNSTLNVFIIYKIS